MTLDTRPETQLAIPAGVFAQIVTSVDHYIDRLFKFRITRPDSFRFRSGEFVMIGLPNAEKPVFRGRITDLLNSGKLFADLGVDPIDPTTDRGMICGSMAMLRDTKAMLEEFGLEEGSNSRPATFVVERAFVD